MAHGDLSNSIDHHKLFRCVPRSERPFKGVIGVMCSSDDRLLEDYGISIEKPAKFNFAGSHICGYFSHNTQLIDST